MMDIGLITCTRCQREKPLTGFGTRVRHGHRVVRHPCHVCRATYERARRAVDRAVVTQTPKQIVRVLEAVQHGIGTSNEIGAIMGKKVQQISSYLTMLRKDGLIQWTGRTMVKPPSCGGRACRVYEVTGNPE